MLGHDAGRSGATAAEIRPPFERKWFRAFPDEGINAGVQPVVAGGKVFVGTLRGVLHAIDAETGKDAWVFRAGGPILHACAADDGRVYFGAADGKVYALGAADGKPAWTVPTGAAVWNAPAIHDGVVYVGSRDGRLYAIDAGSGRVKWSAPTGGPILSSPAVDAKAGRVVIGSEDMHVYALDAGTGRPAWVSDKLQGVSFRGYHPVIAPDGSVMITVMPAAGGDAIQQVLLDMVKEVFGDFASWRHKKDENDRLRKQNFAQLADPQTYAKEMAYLRKRLTDEPALQTFFVLDGATGKQKFVAPIVYAESMNGPAMPPVVTPAGKVLVKYNALLRSRYEHYSPFLNVGTLDTATGDVAPVMDQSRTYGWHDSLLLVHDEQSQLSVGGQVLFNTHQDNVNAMDLQTLRGYPFPMAQNVHEPKPAWPQGIWAAYLNGGDIPRGYEWFARGTAVYGGGSAIDVPISIAGDSFYFLPTHELNAGCCVIAYRMQTDGKASDRGPEPTRKFTPEQWTRVRKELKWDWDTLGTDRLRSILDTLPEKVPGTNGRPLTDEAGVAVAKVTDEELDRIIFDPPKPAAPGDAGNGDETTARLRGQLARAVDKLVSTDWRPLLFPAAKAPAEAYRFFLEPTETLYTLALAYPHLPPELQQKVRERVGHMQAPGGPLAGPVGRRTYDPHAGQVRSAYDPAPESLLKIAEPPLRTDTARLYPLWLWAQTTDDWAKLKADWPAIRPLVSDQPAKGEADCGNGRVAGLIAACRIARQVDDAEFVTAWLPRTRAAMRALLDYELSHTEGGVMTHYGNHTLLGRWHFLTPEVARLCAAHAADTERHLMEAYVDYHRPTWWLAWNVEVMWRNEAPLSFPTVAQDVFAARAMILRENPGALARYVDVPWCKGDETYIQKLAMVLTVAAQ
jgi:hypothetical protein